MGQPPAGAAALDLRQQRLPHAVDRLADPRVHGGRRDRDGGAVRDGAGAARHASRSRTTRSRREDEALLATTASASAACSIVGRSRFRWCWSSPPACSCARSPRWLRCNLGFEQQRRCSIASINPLRSASGARAARYRRCFAVRSRRPRDAGRGECGAVGSDAGQRQRRELRGSRLPDGPDAARARDRMRLLQPGQRRTGSGPTAPRCWPDVTSPTATRGDAPPGRDRQRNVRRRTCTGGKNSNRRCASGRCAVAGSPFDRARDRAATSRTPSTAIVARVPVRRRCTCRTSSTDAPSIMSLSVRTASGLGGRS